MHPSMFDSIGKAIVGGVVAVGIGGLAIGAGAMKLTDVFFGASSDLEVQISDQTMDMAKYGKVDADMICAETLKFQRSLAETLADQEQDGAENTSYVMSATDCAAAFE